MWWMGCNWRGLTCVGGDSGQARQSMSQSILIGETNKDPRHGLRQICEDDERWGQIAD